jgi:limonene-1,2-epoxide hydrolase
MESQIDVVRRFCAAWSDDIGAVELAEFFTNDAVYHNIPLTPVTGREDIANTIAFSSALARQASRASSSASSISRPMVRWF